MGGLISLFVPGLGHAFLGRYRRALGFVAAVVIAVLLFRISTLLWPVQAAFPVFMLGFATGMATVLWAAIDSWRLGRWPAVPRYAWRRRYLVYFGIIVAWYAPNAVAAFAPSWRAFSTPSTSMAPTLQRGDYFFVLAGYFNAHEPQRGDLVVFTLPCDYPQHEPALAAQYRKRCDTSVDFIKRVVGLPGDKIQMKAGILNLNGQPVTRERLGRYSYTEDGRTSTYAQYVETLPGGYRHNIIELSDDQPLDNIDEFTVPPDRYFVLGDNRDDSADGRDPMSGVGYVPRADLVGKAAFVYFSIDKAASARRSTALPAFRWERIGMPVS